MAPSRNMGVSSVLGSLPSPSPHTSSTRTQRRPEREQTSSVSSCFQPCPVGAAPLRAPARGSLSGASETSPPPTSVLGAVPPPHPPPLDVEGADFEVDDPAVRELVGVEREDVLHAATT